MSGTYKLTIEQIRQLNRIQVDLDDLTREVMFSQCQRICPYKECEQEVEAQKTDIQHTKSKIPTVNDVMVDRELTIENTIPYAVEQTIIYCSRYFGHL